MRLALFLTLAACATTPKAAPRQVVCELDIELLSEPYVGRASIPNDSRKTLHDARELACAALHAASPQSDCDDPMQVVESTRTFFPLQGGVVTPGAEVTLRRVMSLAHQRAEGRAATPLELCRSTAASLCRARSDGLSCYQEGMECSVLDENASRCSPTERARVRPSF